MRTLEKITESIVKTYNNKEMLNFIDLRDLDDMLNGSNLNYGEERDTKNRLLLKSFIDTYNNKQDINSLQVSSLLELCNQ